MRPSHTPSWKKVPAWLVRSGKLGDIRWQIIDGTPASTNTAALMLYLALCLSSFEEGAEAQTTQVAYLTYDELQHQTGLSRAKVSAGLRLLIELNLISLTGTQKRRGYLIEWGDKTRWAKIPCRSLMNQHGQISPLLSFTLRGKHELHALKLFFYLADIRDTKTYYATASYETIYDKVKIPERDIRKAISLLIAHGFLQSVSTEHSKDTKKNEPNKYFLTGYKSLVINS